MSPPQVVTVGERGVSGLSNLEMVRVDVSQLSDDDLGSLFRRAVFMRADAAIHRCGEAILGRDDFAGGLNRQDVYLSLARSASDPDEILKWIAQGREAAIAESQSPAQWYIMELPLRLQRGEVDQFERIMNTLRANHFQEPGVAEQVYQLLVRLGIITPDGQPARRGGGPASPMAEAPASAEPTGGIWTPEGDAAAARNSGKESKLWVPD